MVTVPFTEFQKQLLYNQQGQIVLNKKGEPVKRLTPVNQKVNGKYLVEFIGNILPKINHHRNMLKLYRSSIKSFYQLFLGARIDIDFSENLTLGIKFEPQSLHWGKKQITIHSGIVKCDGEKSYHPYVNDIKKHDQAFVKLAVTEMLENTNMPDLAPIIVESDNCKAQYKSCHHYIDMQNVLDKFKCMLIRIFGIEGHGKGEVDHVGGVVKVAVRQQIARGDLFTTASEVKEFLMETFGRKEHPKYYM